MSGGYVIEIPEGCDDELEFAIFEVVLVPIEGTPFGRWVLKEEA